MTKHDGFTLLETLITTLILVTGLTGVAGAFSYCRLRSSLILQETAAIALMSSKIEEVKAAEEIHPGRYSEYVALMPDGTAVVCEPGSAAYQRRWEITAEMPGKVTVIVYGRAAGRSVSFRELARATTQLGARF